MQNTYVHVLNTRDHADFLETLPADPITGEELQEGDQVVVCAGCKSAFLEESWHYMGSKHCQQSDTLPDIPILKTLQLRWNPGAVLFQNDIVPEKHSWWLSIFVTLSFLLLHLVGNTHDIFLTSYVVFSFIWIIHQSQRLLYKLTVYRNAIHIHFPFKIKGKKTEQISLGNLQKIAYIERQGIGDFRPPLLILTDKNGKERRLALPRDMRRTQTRHDFFKSLGLISREVSVEIRTHDRKEQQYLQRLTHDPQRFRVL
ncbi:MAG: hypothetical protein ACFCUI_03750 [Bernardetiaceae bacterium]